jgi:DNA-binding protein HU-beta
MANKNENILKKDDLVNALSEKGYTKKDSSVIIDDVMAMIMEQLAEGNSIMFYGFGKFELRESKPREMVKVGTGEKIDLPSYPYIKFVPGVELKRAIREGYARTK